MLTFIYEALRCFFAHKAVSDYLFPIASGIYITFVTVRVVQFQDAKRTARKELDMIDGAIRSAPTNLRFGEWNSLILSLRSQFVTSPYEFKTLLHKKASQNIDYLIDRITGRLLTALANVEVKPLGLKTRRTPEEVEMLTRENEGLSFRHDVAKAMRESLPEYQAEIERLPISWITIFGLRGADSLIRGTIESIDVRLAESQRRNVTPCVKCGKDPANIV